MVAVMASLAELLARDGFKNQESKPRAKVLHATRASSMPLHHAHGTNLLSPPANPRPGEGRTRSSGDLPRGKNPAIGCKEQVNEIPSLGGGNFNAVPSRRLPRHNKGGAGVAPALDEAATWALVSILSDHIGCFFKDENFRMFLRQKCYYCLRFAENGDDQNDGGPVAQLRAAVATIERSVQEFPDRIDLKKSCAQLGSIITAGSGSTTPLKGGFTSGIPAGSRLSACAHLYLSVICKMTKKDRASAEHLLQVFCDSPFEARTILLPDLWESLLLPHLHHLMEWYVEEAEGIAGTPCRQIKMKLLERVHCDALDKGTYQIAAYYKGWVIGGMEAPSYPSICFPSPSSSVTSHGGSQSQVVVSPSSSASSRPLISRKLYESIFDRSRIKDVANEQEGGGEEYWDEKLHCDCGGRSCGGDVEDDHETGHCSSRPMMRRVVDRKQEDFPVC